MRKYKVCVFTGTRAEYGLLRPLMALIRNDIGLSLQVIAAGMHLDSRFGSTFRQILRDGFSIDAKVHLPLADDSPVGLCRATSKALSGLSLAYSKLKPEAVVILGDRFEALAAAIAAAFMRIPIVHIHGGESTFGLIDEPIRHSITKMSWLHFTATEVYRSRVIQLGEHPRSVYNVGAIGIDNIHSMKLLSKEKLGQLIGMELGEKLAAVTFHPVTLEKEDPGMQFEELLKALKSFPELKLVITMPNADIGSQSIMELIKKFSAGNLGRAKVFSSLGQLGYLSLLKHSSLVIGNSSSGIIEAPSFRIPTVNIGDRQKGRIQSETVINCMPRAGSIKAAIHKALSNDFQACCAKAANPYGHGAVSVKILKVLKRELSRGVNLKKEFYDLKNVC